ncbi:CoA transferase [Microbacterium sp. GXF7504]
MTAPLGTVGREAAAALGLPTAVLDAIEAPVGGMPWRARLPVATLAVDAVTVASLAIARVDAERRGGALGAVRVDRARVAASFGSERLLRIDGRAPDVWAPLSGFWETADGWVRTHANYPHHAAALRTLLGLPDDADAAAMAAATRGRSAADLEDAAHALGAVVGAVRTADAWRRHPHGAQVASAPLVVRTRTGDAPARPWRDGDGPLGGVRVLDLTRVLAGPIATRDLASAGAEVLRVDTARLPETGWIHLDTGQGKRSALLDLADRADRAVFETLLTAADVVVTGYRPGALDRFGLTPGALAERHPGLVTASVSAWGWSGPWAQRRGFDSIVQAVSGIAMAETADGTTPGALPAQALDHGTGHLLAAGIALALAEQRRTGGSLDVRLSLARTAASLLASTDAAPEPDDVELPTRDRRVGALTVTSAPPVLAFPGAPADYTAVGGRWGADPPAWSA